MIKKLLKRLAMWSERYGSQTRIVIYDDGSGHVQSSDLGKCGFPDDDSRVGSFSSLEEFLTMDVK